MDMVSFTTGAAEIRMRQEENGKMTLKARLSRNVRRPCRGKSVPGPSPHAASKESAACGLGVHPSVGIKLETRRAAVDKIDIHVVGLKDGAR
mgnify:CR=1 FL=1